MSRFSSFTMHLLAAVLLPAGLAGCGLSDDAELTSLSSEQQSQLCAEMCAGHEPFELECDDLTFSSDDDEAGCIETCEESLASFNDCDKTVADYREITVTGDSTCEEAGDAFAASLAIQLACSPQE